MLIGLTRRFQIGEGLNPLKQGVLNQQVKKATSGLSVKVERMLYMINLAGDCPDANRSTRNHNS